ncbi:MAG: DUF1722 domain-containing protein [Candidatus Cloacimonetes bacterium]|nr:DUF1722 domain-containing protein [Candidatus Cloacimonadota bacterium]
MSFKYYTPRLIVSKCLGFCNCRFDGSVLNSQTIEMLKPFAEINTVCPETEIGLPTPREALRLIRANNEEEIRLVLSYSGNDYTEKMKEYSKEVLSRFGEVDGFILKNRSPSCGTRDVKVYPSAGKVMIKDEKSSGIFAEQAMQIFPNSLFEDDGRLTNFVIREHFLTSIFALAHWRNVKSSNEHKELVQFHSEYKYLFMTFHQDTLSKMGKVVANQNKLSFQEVVQQYETLLNLILRHTPDPGKNINVLQHIFGYFSKHLQEPEKVLFLEMIEMYRKGRIPLSVPRFLLTSYARRFDEEYIANQRFFAPYPEELITISDSGKGR